MIKLWRNGVKGRVKMQSQIVFVSSNTVHTFSCSDYFLVSACKKSHYPSFCFVA